LVLFVLLLIGINILGLLAFGIGLFVTIPVTFVANAWVFKKLTSFQSP
jgi:uncharacterized membrane protein